MTDINAVFDRLDHWKLLPSLPVGTTGRHLLLPVSPARLESALGTPINGAIVPEFPVKQVRTNRSDKVDYLAVTADGKSLVYVELKTDDNSIRRTQFEYLIRAASRRPRRVLEDLQQIAKATRQKIKYTALQSIMEQMGLAGPNLERFLSLATWSWFSRIAMLSRGLRRCSPTRRYLSASLAFISSRRSYRATKIRFRSDSPSRWTFGHRPKAMSKCR